MQASKKKIYLSVINNFGSDQRVQKICTTLINAGYNTTVIRTDLRGKPIVKGKFNLSTIHLNNTKGMGLYAEFQWKLFWKLYYTVEENSILYANDLDALLPNYWVAKWKKCVLIFDNHEIFSELPSVQGRFSQKVWKFLEKKLVPKTDFRITVSEGCANWINQQYGVQSLVISNYPNRKISEINSINNPPYIIYQGELNKGRGLEKLIHAMHQVDIPLHIYGDGVLLPTLQEIISKENLQHKVFLKGRVSPQELHQITPTATMGVSLEEDLGLSYRYSLPNKLFDYIQTGIPVVATNLPEISQIVTENKVGEVIQDHSVESIVQAIETILHNGKDYYKPSLKKAAAIYTWESQESEFLHLFDLACKLHK